MRRVATSLVLALGLLGCAPRGEQVPLITVAGAQGGGCILLYEVVDVISDPEFGTVVKDGWPLRWPTGYTAWRVGTEVEVVNGSGNVVLRTGGRYKIGPALINSDYSPPLPEWVVGCIDPCPACPLGHGVSTVLVGMAGEEGFEPSIP